MDEGTEQSRKVDMVFPNPRFNEDSYMEADIALVHLTTPFELNDDVQIIEMITKEEKPVGGETLRVSGLSAKKYYITVL